MTLTTQYNIQNHTINTKLHFAYNTVDDHHVFKLHLEVTWRPIRNFDPREDDIRQVT